jgi:large subunit ribosomal protein L24
MYADGRIWSTDTGEEPQPKREADTPVHLSDVRLVVPYRITTKTATGQSKEILQDVIVDKLVMERHTTGIDPFTQVDYGKDEFPEKHRFDPETGLPIFKRYIAGTKSIIQWPWEFDPEEQKDLARQEESPSDVKPEVQKGRLRRSIEWVKGTTSSATKAMITSTKQREEEKERKKLEEEERELSNIEKGIQEAQEQPYPKSKEERVRPDSDDDTGRHYAEVTPETRSFYPTLVYPPFPNELSTELAQDIRIQSWADAKDKSDTNTAAQDMARQFQQRKEAAEQKEVEMLEVMKTPMQLRWEVEREKKLREAKPLVQTDALLLALGSHMQAKGIKLTPKRMKAAGEEVHID